MGNNVKEGEGRKILTYIETLFLGKLLSKIIYLSIKDG